MAAARRIVIHEDDLGMCHGANLAFAELTAAGVCTAGAVMVPCPWFLEIAEMQARDPRLDIGVHLTLTAEKRNYRWRPLTGASQASGLVDDDGFFWRTAAAVRANAHPQAVEAELRAQIEAAKAAGIDITHLDAHMFTVVCPQFIDIYVRLGREERVPVLLVRQENAYGSMQKGAEVTAAVEAAEAAGLPVFDIVLETPWQRGKSVEGDYEKLLDRISPGLTYMALHFNAPGEVEAIEPDSAHLRIEEHRLFKSAPMRARLKALAGELTGMRVFRDRLRAS
jgi:predicted glycoside hydrolase/deacetylase ChbG (UPF0249 family)